MEIKSHTCEKGGVQLSISFWHLPMNLKNKYLLEKLLKWVNKKQNNFNTYNIAFKKKKIKKKTWRYHCACVSKILMIWSTGPFFLLFYPTNNPENQNFRKIKKKTPGDIILHMCNINDNHMIIDYIIIGLFQLGLWHVVHKIQVLNKY